MHLLVCPARSGPLDTSEIVHVGFEDKALVTKDLVEHILDGIIGISLVLQAQEAATIVTQEHGNLQLQTLSPLNHI